MKVYDQIGCLTAIKAHLRKYNINEYKSVNELINFQKEYFFLRQQIFARHKILIEQEKDKLNDEVTHLEHLINEKKSMLESRSASDIERSPYQIYHQHSARPSSIQTLTDNIKTIVVKLVVQIKMLIFKGKIYYSIKYLSSRYNEKVSRYKYILSSFEDAVNQSSLLQQQELDRKKRVIDQISSFIYGAIGEQKVVKELEKLSDDHILINDFSCEFKYPIYDAKNNDHIRSIQIDHILISPSGVFLIETKNWSKASINDPSLFSPVKQIRRTSFVLFKILNGEIADKRLLLAKHPWAKQKISIRNLIVFMDNKPSEEFQYVKILTLNNLLSYINYFNACYSSDESRLIADRLLDFMKK